MCWLPIPTQRKWLSPAGQHCYKEHVRHTTSSTQASTHPCSLTQAQTDPQTHPQTHACAYKVCLNLASGILIISRCSLFIIPINDIAHILRVGEVSGVLTLLQYFVLISQGLGRLDVFHRDGCVLQRPNIIVLTFPCSAPPDWLTERTSPCFTTTKTGPRDGVVGVGTVWYV